MGYPSGGGAVEVAARARRPTGPFAPRSSPLNPIADLPRTCPQKIDYATTTSHATVAQHEGPEAVYAIKLGLRTADGKAASSSKVTVSGAGNRLVQEQNTKRARENGEVEEEEDDESDEGEPEAKKHKEDDDDGAPTPPLDLRPGSIFGARVADCNS